LQIGRSVTVKSRVGNLHEEQTNDMQINREQNATPSSVESWFRADRIAINARSACFPA